MGSAHRAPWRPRVFPFLLFYALIVAVCGYVYRPDETVQGWILTIVWSMPAVGIAVGVQGIFLSRLRARQLDRLPLPEPATAETLLVVVPTIGRDDTYPALARSVRSYVAHLPEWFRGGFRVDIVTEEGCSAGAKIDELAAEDPRIRVVTVPKRYVTPRGTRFKARANHYAHELRRAEGEARDDVWVLHMDDDTGVGRDTAIALAQFLQAQRSAKSFRQKHLAQGILCYPREYAHSRFTWFADAVRPADDISRFRALTGLGTPLAGLHGELLVIRASVEAEIGWDFGPRCIVEDAQLALHFCRRYPGRSDWFAGRSYGASPATVPDFVRQRARWAQGLLRLSLTRSVPLKQRAFLAVNVLAWVLSPFQHISIVLLVAWLTGHMNTAPVTASVILVWGLNFAYTLWMYWEGLRINAQASVRGWGMRRWWEPPLVLLGIPVFAMLEGWGTALGLFRFVFLGRRRTEFTVIAKPA
ncbi:membrane glycosyltransferase [Mangrovactinospora gilvigrisea]|uniref:Membrane glycosyltransferase n=1 Tax=Mangrovactinospora gilvigrisea TaxID=1428644 RepID=A0A1J7BDE0_9ACTN|nr:membrane glycosyltransferase [Mangrovactinospora gilvigrisea]